MQWEDALQAWVASDIEDCLCPVCGLQLKIGWQQCQCGELLNVEKISAEDGVSFLVTREQDEMQELMDSIEKKKDNYQTYLV